MSFFSICPRDKVYMDFAVNAIQLRVVQSDGVNITPDIKFDKVTLQGNTKLYRNQSGDQDSFKISIVLDTNDTVFGYKGNLSIDARPGADVESMVRTLAGYNPIEMTRISTIDLLDYYIRKGHPFYILTDAVGIPQGELWLVTEQKNRKQTHKGVTIVDDDGKSYERAYVIWDLTFTKYKEVSIGSFKASSAGVTKALKNYEKAKKKASQTQKTKSKTTLKDRLKKCKRSVLKYSSTKKVVACVKVMQGILYKAGKLKGEKKTVIDGWYGNKTRDAVKAYQKDYKNAYGCKTDGNIDEVTYKVMCGTAKKLTQTVNISQGASAQQKQATGSNGIVNVNVTKSNSKNAELNGTKLTVKSTSVQSTSTSKTTTKKATKKSSDTSKKTTKKESKKTETKSKSKSSSKSSTSNKKSSKSKSKK